MTKDTKKAQAVVFDG